MISIISSSVMGERYIEEETGSFKKLQKLVSNIFPYCSSLRLSATVPKYLLNSEQIARLLEIIVPLTSIALAVGKLAPLFF